VSKAPSAAPAPQFGHPPETIEFWKRLVTETLSLVPTPCYVFSSEPVAERIAELDQELVRAGFKLPATARPGQISIRHWLSCKTQPVAPLLRWWREQSRPIEVVSEFELRAALACGYSPENILVNGPAKHPWLTAFDLPQLTVHFDSEAELKSLLPLAKKQNWRVGIRILTGEEFDPENPQYPTQFGFEPNSAVAALRKLLHSKVRLETVHFHLRPNISATRIYQQAIAEVADICQTAKFSPRCLDIGGGIPVRHVLSRGSKVFDGEFGLRSFAQMLRQAVKAFPDLRELWLENGRFVSSDSGVLVVKILDVKERRSVRQLICDGGRTMNALTSLWEQHALIPLPQRTGPTALTVVHGPTCMAFDQLARIPLPRSLRSGDHLIWLDAGAYHLPWETRFSHGHAAVCWHDNQGLRLIRPRQTFDNWWSQWQ
jgi:diaminopimelate decarboxylase